MAEILSQEEINTLLSGKPAESSQAALAARGEDREPEVFDFRLPHRLSKAQLRSFQAVHEGFAETFGSYLVSRLQTNVTVSALPVGQRFYSEFASSVVAPTCLYIFRIVESDALALLEVSSVLALTLVEQLMGGVAEGEKRARAITKIEQSIIRGIIQRALVDIQSAWKTVAELNFKLERYESEGDLARIAPASEIVVVGGFDVAVGSRKYAMRLCFPTFALDHVLEKLNAQQEGANAVVKQPAEAGTALLPHLETTSLEVTAILGETTLTVRELLELEQGDILKTKISTDEDVRMLIGGKTKMWGHPGLSQGRLAVKVSRTIQDSDTGE